MPLVSNNNKHPTSTLKNILQSLWVLCLQLEVSDARYRDQTTKLLVSVRDFKPDTEQNIIKLRNAYLFLISSYIILISSVLDNPNLSNEEIKRNQTFFKKHEETLRYACSLPYREHTNCFSRQSPNETENNSANANQLPSSHPRKQV